MGYCIKCGAKVEDGIRYCPQCGAEVPIDGNANRDSGFNPYQDYQQSGPQYSNYGPGGGAYQQANEVYFDQNDVRQNKVMAVLAYLGILVLVPLLARDKNSEYARFHTNQGLVLWITGVLVNLLTGGRFFGLRFLVYFDWWITSLIGGILGVVLFVFAIVGIVYACQGQKRELPVIGKIKIIK